MLYTDVYWQFRVTASLELTFLATKRFILFEGIKSWMSLNAVTQCRHLLIDYGPCLMLNPYAYWCYWPFWDRQGKWSESRIEQLGGREKHISRLICGSSPLWVSFQVKHGNTPCVHGQRDGEDTQDVHDKTSLHLETKQNIHWTMNRHKVVQFTLVSRASVATYHVFDHEMTGGKGDGVGWGWHRQHEGIRTSYCSRYHEVQWIHCDTNGLQRKSHSLLLPGQICYMTQLIEYISYGLSLWDWHIV